MELVVNLILVQLKRPNNTTPYWKGKKHLSLWKNTISLCQCYLVVLADIIGTLFGDMWFMLSSQTHTSPALKVLIIHQAVPQLLARQPSNVNIFVIFSILSHEVL